MDIDETMSEEVAFIGDNKQDDVFKFDPVKADEVPTSDSQDEKESDVSSEEESRVPYSRFKKVESKLEERDSMIASLEERLAGLESARTESTHNSDELDVPKEWVELYGDSDVSKRAYKIQLQREEQLQENAIARALQQFRDEESNQEKQVRENEQTIDENLSALGVKLTPKQEEKLLSIVDEFSPTGSDGKYISLFPFDKALEIMNLRENKVSNKTNQARTVVADLTGNNSEGEIDSSSADFKRGWDNWREAI